MTDRVGQQLGNYQLTRLLGEGGFAEVYLGEHIHLGTQAAIKVLHTQLTSDDVDKFRIEARTIAHLVHPHIVRVFEFGVEGKTPFLVMDYAPHGTLRQLHPKGTRLPFDIIVSYVKQVAEALQYAHDEKLIHRDVKPENMLLGRRNEVLLSDFGIALVAQSSRYQSTQEMVGTMAYMAPEQIQGKARPASDQYSLGIVVYEWICGDRPFHGSLTELVGQHLSAPPPSLCEKISTISSAIEAVVLKALTKDPKQRFASIQDFVHALEQAYLEEIIVLLSKPELTAEVLSQEHVQQRLLDLTVTNPNWWNTSGRTKINNFRTQAEKESQAEVSAILTALARKAVRRVGVAIESEDGVGCLNLLHLIEEATPPSTNPDVWIFLLESLSTHPQALKAISGNWETYSLLLEQWGRISSSVENKLIRLWFPTTWPDFWRFLALHLPEEWHDLALTDLLDATSHAPLSPATLRSIEQEHHSLVENYLRRPFYFSSQLGTEVRLFAKLAKDGYARKMELLHILLAPDMGETIHISFIEKVLVSACLTEKEIVELLEGYGSQFEPYYQLPSVSGFVKQYLFAFSPRDLDRTSAKQLVQFMSSNSSIQLPPEVRALAQNWHTISRFIDQPAINKKELLALTSAVNQLPATTHSMLIGKLGTSFTSCIESEVDLMCVIYAMTTVLTESALLHFLHHMAEIVGKKYKRTRSEASLVPYIRIALQTETIVHSVPTAEQQEFVTRFLETLLKHANRKTYERLNTLARAWPAGISSKWLAYIPDDFKFTGLSQFSWIAGIAHFFGRMEIASIHHANYDEKLASSQSRSNSKGGKEPVLALSLRNRENSISPSRSIGNRQIINRLRGISKGKAAVLLVLVLFIIGGSAGGAFFYVSSFNYLQRMSLLNASIANPYPPNSGHLALNDPLRDNSNGYFWNTGGDTHGRCTFTGGALHVSAQNSYAHYCSAGATNFSNFAYQIQMTIVHGGGEIVFHLDEATLNFYSFIIRQDGYYELDRYAYNKLSQTLRSDSNAAIKSDLNQSNLIAVVANGSNFDLYMNNNLLTTVSDRAYNQGEVGVGAYNTGNQSEVIFSNAKVWTF